METLSQRFFEEDADALKEVKSLLGELPHTDIGWDSYDWSLEIIGVPPDVRLSDEQYKALIEVAGFSIVYLNHTNDAWETHYGSKNRKGWRVSYPHKRPNTPNDDGKIWVEEVVDSWPNDWFINAGHSPSRNGVSKD